MRATPGYSRIAGLAAVLALAFPAALAHATVPPRPFQEAFGPLAQPKFTNAGSLAFDRANGDLLGVDQNPANETQALKIEAASNLGGTYKLSFEGQGTGWEGEATLSGGETGTGDIVGVEGTGTLEHASTIITGVTAAPGAFVVGQAIETPEGSNYIAPGTTITAINEAEQKLTLSQPVGNGGLRRLVAGSTEVKNVAGSFTAGKAISGPGIQLGTTITAVGAGALTLSKPPTDTASGVALTAGSLEATAMHTTSGALVKGERISGTNVQPGTGVTAVNEGAGTFALSLPPTASGVSTDLKADLPFDAGANNNTIYSNSINEALQELPGIGSGNVTVQGEQKNVSSPIERKIEFRKALEKRPLGLITCDGSGLTGASPTCAVSETAAGHREGVFRYREDGAPAPFAALGANVIDGRLGYGGRPCGEEPSSCDATPQGGFEGVGQIAIDESTTASDGDVYLADTGRKLIDVFAPDGHYLGQILKFKSGGTESSFGEVSGIAVSPTGALYVADAAKNLIHEYVPQGAPHNPLSVADSVANFNAVASPTVLAAGAGPSAGSLFAATQRDALAKLDADTGALDYKLFDLKKPGNDFVSSLSVNPADGRLFVGVEVEEAAVREYDASGAASATLTSQATLPDPFDSAPGIAANPGTDQLYVALHSSPSTPEIQTYAAALTPTVATGPISNLGETSATLNGTVAPNGQLLESCVFEWGLAEAPYEHAEPCAETAAEIGAGKEPVGVHLDLSGLAKGARYHYRLAATNVDGSSEGADRAFTMPRPPAISEESVQSVTGTEAIVGAKIDPEGFASTYEVEYGPGEAYGQSTPKRALGPVDASPHQVTVHLEGLAPGGTYHFRFVADDTSASLPGTGVAAGEDRVFATFAPFVPEADCANQALRTGLSATLPDCRAYELVSPLDKEGADILPLNEATTGLPASLDQASTSGGKLAYGSYRAFGNAQSAPWTTQYVASRGAEGWQSHAITPPRERLDVLGPATLDTELKALSPDLCQAWLRTVAEPVLAPGAQSGFTNLYRRLDSEPGCGGESYEALTTAEPAHGGQGLELLGRSADGKAAIFAEEDNLAGTGAPDTETEQRALYYQEAGEGTPHYVCVLPNKEAIGEGAHPGESCTAGTGSSEGGQNRSDSLHNAISADGSRVFWTAYKGPGRIEVPGEIYLRADPGKPSSASGGCDEAEKACSLAISAEAEALAGSTGSGAQYWTAASDGSRVLLSTGGKLFEVEIEEPAPGQLTAHTALLAPKFVGMAGASEDAKWVYLASEEVLGGAGEENSFGKEAVAGKPNLYLLHEGGFRFVATLLAGDKTSFHSPIGSQPRFSTSRVSADGQHLALMTQAPLGEYDNRDASSGEADAEVYLYDASGDGGAGKLLCASCNPSGARPDGEDIEKGQGEFWVAAQMPVWENTLYVSRALSEDGKRLFFESSDALTPQDSNGVQDVYEWEAPGAGRCEEGGSGYSAQDEGCVFLISSGKSPQVAKFLDASPSGDDVFFATLSGLVPQDYGLTDIYDARVGGGFPVPASAAAQCEGEACQPAAGAPPGPNLGFAVLEADGNLHEAKQPCPRGRRAVKRPGGVRCVKRPAGRHRRSHANQRGTRR